METNSRGKCRLAACVQTQAPALSSPVICPPPALSPPGPLSKATREQKSTLPILTGSAPSGPRWRAASPRVPGNKHLVGALSKLLKVPQTNKTRPGPRSHGCRRGDNESPGWSFLLLQRGEELGGLPWNTTAWWLKHRRLSSHRSRNAGSRCRGVGDG